MRIYRLITKIYPKKLFEKYKELIEHAGLEIEPHRFTGSIILFGLAASLLIGFGAYTLLKANILTISAITFLCFQLMIYVWLVLKVDSRAKSMEKALPDALQLMASNLRAGLTMEKALLLAARPEFGELTKEITRVGKEVMIGKEITIAMLEMAKRTRSEKLNKTIKLIVSGLRSGGELSALVEQTARNLRDQEFVDQKIRSNIKMYAVFIFTAIGFGAPILYALSTFLVEVMQTIISRVQIPKESISMTNMPLTITNPSITPEFVVIYATASLVMTASLGSLILGEISKGEEKQGFRIMPILIALSLLVFFVARFVVSKLLGGLVVGL